MFVAALWGFAEATLFVVVADVWIGFVALEHGWRAGARAALAASLGAALGGLVMMVWARSDPDGVRAVLAALPAIDAAMVRRVAASYAADGLRAAFLGSFSGIPYKPYASAAGASGSSIALFVFLTPAIRLPRFLLVAAVASVVGRALQGRLSRSRLRAVYAVVWLAFYAAYFGIMP